MKQAIGYVALVVRDYDEAIRFYVETLGFRLVEDTFIEAQQKRWVLVAPPGSAETRLLLARAVGDEQAARVGNQAGGRVFLFLHTDDFWSDYRRLTSQGVVFVRPPAEQPYGTVAVFEDLYGNLWDLLQLKGGSPQADAGIDRGIPMGDVAAPEHRSVMIQRLRAAHEAIPFQPFAVHMADGRRFSVPHPDSFFMSPSGRTILICEETEDFSILDFQRITGIEMPPEDTHET